MKHATKLLLTKIIFLVLIFSFSNNVFAQSLILSPDFQELNIEEEFFVEVLVSSDKKLVGADAILNFDQDILEVLSIDNGNAFSKTALKSTGEGKIKITGIEEERGKTFSGEGLLATIIFRAKDAGDTTVELEFTSGSTTDSNLATPQVTDALVEVQNGQYLIGSPIQRGTASLKRFVIKAFPFLIFLVFLGTAGFFGYRWWKQQQIKPRGVFEQRKVPMDKAPD